MSLSLKTLENWLWDAACTIRGPVDAPIGFFERSWAYGCGFGHRGCERGSGTRGGNKIAEIYHEWKEEEEGLSKVITDEEAACNDYNLSPSRYVATNDHEDVLPLEDTVVLLREAEEERAEANRKLREVLGVGSFSLGKEG